MDDEMRAAFQRVFDQFESLLRRNEEFLDELRAMREAPRKDGGGTRDNVRDQLTWHAKSDPR